MRKLFVAFAAVVALLSACKKENSLEDFSKTPGTVVTPAPLGKLARMVSAAGADSTTTDYSYDGAGRLVAVNYTSTTGGNQYTRLYRNATGALTRYSSKSDALDSIGIDSIVTIVNYDAVLERYTSTISDITFMGVTYRDSTVFSYDGNGHLANKTAWAKAGPSNYQLYSKTDYTYTGSNVTAEKYHTFNPGTSGWDLEATYNYSYDDKEHPLPLGAESLFTLDDPSYGGTNNAILFSFNDNVDPSNNYALNTTYTYNAANNPEGGVAVESPGSGTYELRYYYN